MVISRIKELLQDMNWRAVADKSGVSYETVRRVAKDPKRTSAEVTERLSKYFEGRCEK
jgi:hypothetical protein